MLGFRCKPLIAGIADRDRDIAHETIAAGAFDRGLGKQRSERCIVEPRQLGKLRRGEHFARREFGVAAYLRELVPGADREAVVAAVDAVAERRAKFARDRSLLFDRQIGNAAPGVEPIGSSERAGGTYVETGTAAPAAINLGLVRCQLERGEDRREKEPGAELAGHEIRVLALPAESSRGGQRLLHDRCGIDKHPYVAAGLREEP